MIVLMKLRGMQDITYWLGICTSTVSRRFHEMFDLTYCHLKWFIKWPEREEPWKTMPSCFRETYGTKFVVVIDCFEVKIETPTQLVAKIIQSVSIQTCKYSEGAHCNVPTRCHKLHFTCLG